MNLSLLAPLALVATALVAVPIFLHLIDQRKVPLQDFPALRFLRQAQKRLRRQSRVRDRWLLLARILALMALVLAAAAPLFTYDEEIPAGTELAPNVVFLLDRSLSMGYEAEGGEAVFDRALDMLQLVINALPEGSRVGLIVFDERPVDPVGGLIPDKRRVLRLAQEVEVGYGQTDLRSAILAGVRALVASPEGEGDLYLLTDLTDASLAGELPIDLPEQMVGKVRLVIPELAGQSPMNRSLVGASITGGVGTDAPITVTAEVRGEGDPGEGTLDLSIEGESVSRGFVDTGREGRVKKPFSIPADAEHRGFGSLTLSEDGLMADNQWFFRLSQRRNLRVLVIDGDPGTNLAGGETYFLERALSPQASSTASITPVIVGPGAALKQRLSDYAVVFLTNVADPAPFASSLRAFVEGGGGLFIAGGDHVSAERYNSSLRSLLPASLGQTIAAAQDVTGETPPSLAYPKVMHPVFRVFREAGAKVFGTTHFFRVIPTSPSLKEGAEVLLKFSTGLPALLSRRVGEGRVFFFASTLDRGWTDFPLKSIFLPFIQESVHFLAANPAADLEARQQRVGQLVTVSVPPQTRDLSVQLPSGERVVMEPVGADSSDTGAGALSRRVLRRTPQPGVYQVFEAGADEGQAPVLRDDLSFTVNVSEVESRLAPLDVERLKAVTPDIVTVIAGQGAESQAFVTVQRERKLARPLLWALLLFLIIEGAMTLRRHGVQTDGEEGGGGSERIEEVKAA